MTIEERIAERQKIRAQIHSQVTGEGHWEDTLLLISESIDDYIDHRIETDKAMVGILKDIQANTATISETRIEKLLTQNV